MKNVRFLSIVVLSGLIALFSASSQFLYAECQEDLNPETQIELKKDLGLRSQYGLPANHKVLKHQFDVRKYTLNVTPDLDTGFIDAIVTIKSKSTKNGLKKVRFNFVGDWEIKKVTVDGADINWKHNGAVLTAKLGKRVDNEGEFVIEVRYSGIPARDPYGLGGERYQTFNIKDGVHAFTFFQPFSARYFFPCFDEPSDKAEEGCELTITAPEDLTAVSNGLLESVKNEGDNRVFHYRHQYPIATYLIAFVIGPYEIINDQFRKIPIEYYAYPELVEDTRERFARTPDMLNCFTELFGEYPFEKYSLVIVPVSSLYGMEHQTMTIINDKAITHTSNFDTVLAHELSHHWWGDSVTIEDYREIWLNEGFATYCQFLWGEYYFGQGYTDSRMVGWRELFLEDELSQTLPIVVPDYDMENMFSHIPYGKAAYVLYMLHKELGNKKFINGLKEYYRRHAYGNVTTSDFVDAMEWVSGRELDAFFQGWIYGTGHPVYEISSYYTKLDGQLKSVVTVHQAQANPTTFAMTLPIDPDGDGPAGIMRQYVEGRWCQFEVDVSAQGGAATISDSPPLLLTSKQVDYPEPVITSVPKSDLVVGKTSKVKIKGANFTPVTRVRLSKKNIGIDSFSVSKSGNKIRLKLSVPADMKPGPVDLTLTNPDGDSVKKPKALRVTKSK